MKLLIDMNLSPGWAGFLRSAGFEAVHWSKIGEVSAPDIEIMRYAAQWGYCVLTNDLDFGSILAVTQGEKPSVIQIRSDDLSTQGIGTLVASAIQQSIPLLEDGALLTIDPKRVRMRLLPLGR